MQDGIASFHFESAMIASLFIAARENEGSICAIVAVTGEDRGSNCLPRLQGTVPLHFIRRAAWFGSC
jgi:hypothetical protein